MRKIIKLFALILIISAVFINVNVGIETAKADISGYVYLGGTPIGVITKSRGVTVLEITEVITKDGAVRPAEKGGIQKGDFILQINEHPILSPEDINKTLLNYKDGDKVKIKFVRNGETLYSDIELRHDVAVNALKLGLQVKNEIAGVGTLTYVRSDNKRFGGLGHQIFDAEASNKDIYKEGSLFSANIIGCVKGEPGKAGELRGTFKRASDCRGNMDKNNFSGIFGNADKELYALRPIIAVGDKDAVVAGEAYIFTTISGNTPEKYTIEIIKTSKQNEPSDKSMVIKITDERLLNETGGIVQGMSGSPIIQNGKLIGAVTHVFINEPTKGYGIYIDWMINN